MRMQYPIFLIQQVVFTNKSIEDIPDPHLDPFGEECKVLAAQISRHYDFEGPAFSGVLSVQINTPQDPFVEPPLVSFVGGNIDMTGATDPDFVSAQAKAILDGLGFVSEIKISELGAFIILLQPLD